MFYNLIKEKCNEWITSSECTIRELLQYVYDKNKMRDAQIEAIKIYLFLKIACRNKPLWKLFCEGAFNNINLDAMPLTVEERNKLNGNNAAIALLEYSQLKDKTGKPIAPELEKIIKEKTETIDYKTVFKKIFYGVSYTDYLFSLPMGAGKTYLMAAFIYLDLYFAQSEPDNPAFAHNFMIMAPSGLKSSIIPSLKTIQEFDPTWIIPEPTASQLRRMIKFEILDEQKSAKKSNLVRNPNAQKIAIHQPLDNLIGLVAITNAEKVILDRVGGTESTNFLSKEELRQTLIANELRHTIGRIPNLSVFIDEVHHAADGEIKLRQVVEEWAKQNSFCGILGFSGTPYLEKAESVALTDYFTIKNTDLSNVVYHYPLIDGIGNFLKTPEVKYSDNDTETIVANGVKDFLNQYQHTVYANGTYAKLAIYAPQIETLEETIYPIVAKTVAEYGMNPIDVILKHHGGNKAYPQPEHSAAKFVSLDTDLSKIRIVLLVQIGKEGWDCKSLTGVILPQKGACPNNMVLQTSCRCLRQVVKNANETALIWLNKFNADTLNKQLKQQQNITLQELNQGKHKTEIQIKRHVRRDVPPIQFYQLRISYQTLFTEKHPHTYEKLADNNICTKANQTLVNKQNFAGETTGKYIIETYDTEYITFNQWLYQIATESLGNLTRLDLKQYENRLKKIFERVTTTDKSGYTIYNSKYNQEDIRANIRKAFVARRDFTTKEDVVLCQAKLLADDFTQTIQVVDDTRFYPSQNDVDCILDWDKNESDRTLSSLSPEQLALIEQMRQKGYTIPEPTDPHSERKFTYHYLPYRFDSGFERNYFKDTIVPVIKECNFPIEIYFNGDDTMTNFKIDCYKQVGKEWRRDGKYIPDFLLLSRNDDGSIDRVIIIETKGEVFADKFADRLHFMDTEFIDKNNKQFGYERFRFLFLKDSDPVKERETLTIETIKEFFNI